MNNFAKLPVEKMDILFDPQTSGGLILGVVPAQAEKMLQEMKDAGIDAFICGKFTKDVEKIEVIV